MIKKIKKRTLFLIGLIGISALGLIQGGTRSEASNTLSKEQLKNIIQPSIPTASADEAYGPAAGDCPAGPGPCF